MKPILDQSIELGRSFIVEEYQKHRLSLYLLWKGILFVLISEPHHRYVLGPVTISGSYQEVSKNLIMEFVKRHYFDHELAKHITPRQAYVVKSMNIDSDALLNATENDMKKLDKVISDIEPSSYTLPVLLKKYLHQNARILGFNVDPKFNNALDGLMLLDLHNLPQETIESLQYEFNQGVKNEA
jgi:putative hemolysin